MPFRPTGPTHSRLAAFVLLAGTVAGCTKQQSSEQALDKQYQDNPQLKRVQTAKFAGKVTVDGQPPQTGFKLFIILNDPSHLDQAAHSAKPALYAACDEHGHFSFTTVNKDDGVPVGKYVVTFVELRNPAQQESGGRFRRGRMRSVGIMHYEPPDELKNLYNDPDKNAKDDKFVVNVEQPGKDNWDFNLDVAGKEPVPTPGANAVTRL